MNKRRPGFTLIELIIVIVIIGILAVVAIPKYFANIKKAEKAQVLSNLNSIREAMMGYSAANGVLPTIAATASSVIVTVDGDAVMTVAYKAGYSYTAASSTLHAPAINGCTYSMNISTGVPSVSGTGCPTTP
jgi:prepilin-type N-terminal cleavage/methylation domain-containing protein